ncbi:MAG TPA: PaaI family thioesterase [Candidatus Acidoferrales bacterium]|nr:PaaI family thioesterase [Candidatus Acidoferrales bacterium]
MPATFAPRDPAYAERVRRSFERQPLMATLGATLDRVAPGEVEIGLPYRAGLCQQNGYLHAGAVASIADSACGYAAFTLSEPDTDVLAVEFKINLMAPARGSRFVARARVLRSGRTLSVVLADVSADGVDAPVVATMLSTVIIRPRADAADGAREA